MVGKHYLDVRRKKQNPVTLLNSPSGLLAIFPNQKQVKTMPTVTLEVEKLAHTVASHPNATGSIYATGFSLCAVGKTEKTQPI